MEIAADAPKTQSCVGPMPTRWLRSWISVPARVSVPNLGAAKKAEQTFSSKGSLLGYTKLKVPTEQSDGLQFVLIASVFNVR
jgi:hypothetical protein